MVRHLGYVSIFSVRLCYSVYVMLWTLCVSQYVIFCRGMVCISSISCYQSVLLCYVMCVLYSTVWGKGIQINLIQCKVCIISHHDHYALHFFCVFMMQACLHGNVNTWMFRAASDFYGNCREKPCLGAWLGWNLPMACLVGWPQGAEKTYKKKHAMFLQNKGSQSIAFSWFIHGWINSGLWIFMVYHELVDGFMGFTNQGP